MNYIILNIEIENKKIVENIFDSSILKEKAYNSKIKSVDTIYYNIVIIPLLSETIINYLINMNEFKKHFANISTYKEDIIYSIYTILKPAIIELTDFLDNGKYKFDILKIIDDKTFSISYTDGSYNKSTKAASYSLCKLITESKEGIHDDFTNKMFSYKSYANIITNQNNNTNNIGELSGIKAAIENFDNNKIQIIISDSEYSIKCFREWYYTWENQNFKNYAKKDISNKDLILDIKKDIDKSNKNILFKWVKGHDKNSFNEICDKLAKNKLGIKK